MTVFRGDDFPSGYDPHGQPSLESPNDIYFGPFAWNLSSGCSMSNISLLDRQKYINFWHWDQASHIIKEGDRIGCEFNVPFGRWLGHGGTTSYNDAQMDFLTSSVGVAPLTKNMVLPSTAHITYFFHPMQFAKWGAVTDNMTNGRWALNVVGGWIRDEVEIFGVEYPDHDLRYEMCNEFVLFMKLAWDKEEPFDFDGRFFKGKNIFISPKPKRKPRPIFIQAGYSPAGMDFAGRHAEWLFFINVSGNVRDLENAVKRATAAADKYGRRMRFIQYTWNVWEESDDIAEEISMAGADRVDQNTSGLMTYRSLDQPGTKTGAAWAAQLSGEGGIRKGMGEGSWNRNSWGLVARQIIGGYDTVAEHMRVLNKQFNFEGFLTGFFDPLAGIHKMENHLFPRLEKMGLRKRLH